MLIDITLKITPKMITDAQGNEKKALVGHLGTHFDVMNKEFPLEYTRRKGVVFDVSEVTDRDIDVCDIDLDKVESDMFVSFYTGFIEKIGYGGKVYFTEHPKLSNELIDALLDRGVFIIEKLCNLKAVLDNGGHFLANTYPMNYVEMTGLPCRVVAEIL